MSKVSTEQIAAYLKSNNRFKDIDNHVEKLRLNLEYYYKSIFIYLGTLNGLYQNNHFDKKALTNEFWKELINICIEVIYFKNGFCINEVKRFTLVSDKKCEILNSKLNSKNCPLSVQEHLVMKKLSSLLSYEDEERGVMFLPNPILKDFLLNRIQNLKLPENKMEKWNVKFVPYIEDMRYIFKFLKLKYIENSWKEFISVIEKGEGKIKWVGNVNSLVQFFLILKRDTVILDKIKSIDAYIRTYVEFDESKNSFQSAYSNRSKLLKDKNCKGKRRNPKDYDILIQVIDHIHSDLLKY